MKIAKRNDVTCCARCPFVEGMGGGDEMPGFVRCGVDAKKRLVPEPRTTLEQYGDPPPPWCPLREGELVTVVALSPRVK